MEAQEIRYRVNKKVFRQASLYAMFLRNRNTFRVGIVVVLAVAFYTVLAVQGTFPPELPADLHRGGLSCLDAFAARTRGAARAALPQKRRVAAGDGVRSAF